MLLASNLFDHRGIIYHFMHLSVIISILHQFYCCPDCSNLIILKLSNIGLIVCSLLFLLRQRRFWNIYNITLTLHHTLNTKEITPSLLTLPTPQDIMPYNTRRKSVSLTALGIHLPQQSLKASRPSSSNMVDHHPQKRVKRVHDTTSNQRPTFEPTPPPSPSANDFPQDIFEHIVDDEVVASVVTILKESRNRPHTVRELASRIGSGLGVVDK